MNDTSPQSDFSLELNHSMLVLGPREELAPLIDSGFFTISVTDGFFLGFLPLSPLACLVGAT